MHGHLNSSASVSAWYSIDHLRSFPVEHRLARSSNRILTCVWFWGFDRLLCRKLNTMTCNHWDLSASESYLSQLAAMKFPAYPTGSNNSRAAKSISVLNYTLYCCCTAISWQSPEEESMEQSPLTQSWTECASSNWFVFLFTPSVLSSSSDNVRQYLTLAMFAL